MARAAGIYWRQALASLGSADVVREMLAEQDAAKPRPTPMTEAEFAHEVTEELLEEFKPQVRSVEQWAALRQAATNKVAEAAERDAERAAARKNAGYWREHRACSGLPGAA